MDRAKSGGSPSDRRAPLPASRQPRRPRPGVPAIVARIREDAQRDSGEYLEECEVPAGGE
ncbi:MAG: hypothetical protein KC621_10240 [Myxococcales bacterium]|nr:hypothetical protein [Myxococcales bacterium]